MADYWTPAHHAIEHDDAAVLARLLADGNDPDEVQHGMTLLTHAIDAEQDGAAQTGEPLTVHLTAILLAFGADPTLRDPDGNLPEQMAEVHGHQLAALLLQRHLPRPSECD